MTYFDGLTGARNLKKFMIDAEKLVSRNVNTNYLVLVFDIKNFSLFNSIYGREKGDQLLKTIVLILDSIIKGKEIFGRINTDKFVLLLEFSNKDAIRQKMEHFLSKLTEVNVNFKVYITCGCYCVKSEDYNMQENYERSLVAHKLAKQNKGLLDIYYFDNDEKEFNDYRYKAHTIERTMEQALNDGEFKLYMQPQYSITKENIVGVEVLVRWIQKNTIRYFPNEFIRIFEENGFITELDRYIFEEACKVLKYWMDNEIEPVNMSINFSRRNFGNERFPHELLEIANRYEIDCKNITIEITENIAMSNDEVSISCQQLLHNFGFRLSIDDFGTGYSSLSVLKDITADEIKLDKSFFDDILNDKNARSVVKSIFYLVKELNLTSIAEGIETIEQIQFLKETECNIIQGYYYGKPMPVEDINKLLAKV